MKTIIALIALAIAAPAAAQAMDPHAGHDATHEQHKDCCDHKNPDGTRSDCCEQEDGKMMECCAKHAGDKGADAHAHHEMSGH